MRTISIVAAVWLVTANGLAAAQTTPKPNPLQQEDVSRIEGTSVLGGDNAKVGRVSNVLMNPGSKQIDRLVVTTGGVLGIGGRNVAIPAEKFAWDGEKGALRVPMTRLNLKVIPEWVAGGTMTGSTAPSARMPPANAGR
jgi:sporulation protein YlmC with PRC-barrel domain